MKTLTITLSLLALFILGGVCGFAVAAGIVKNTLNEEHLVEQRMNEESRRLHLTTAQIEKAKPGYDQLRRDLSKVKADTIAAITEAVIKQGADLAAILSTEQQAEFKKLIDERRARFEKKIHKP